MSIYRCPVCEQQLRLEAKIYRCEANHSFDIAKEGYVNLLLANQKNSNDPGDNKQMIASRRDFLNLGHYDRISEALNTIITPLITQKDADFTLLDVGCGEGFFVWKLREYLKDDALQSNYDIYATDISKSAIKFASKRDKYSHFSVASLYHLPIEDESVDCLMRIFAPKSYAEFARVLKPQGMFVSVVPGAGHLMELKEILYDNPTRPIEEHDPEIEEFFTLREQIRTQYPILLEGTENIFNLVKMTPYYWTMSQEASDTLAGLNKIELGIDCLLNVYEKKSLRE